jgi:threonine synthase
MLYTDLPADELREIIAASYARFDHPEIAALHALPDLQILELLHGPTLSFKDIALQLLGNLFSHILAKDKSRLNILAATSGDTGSAAIEGMRGRDNINIFVMHPKGGVSALQERQMTSVLAPNVFNLAVSGSFDDCQGIMKSIFSDNEYKRAHALGSVNSVNWARIMAQIVYYFHSYFRLSEKLGCAQIQYAVPTGNFGDILAGYYAKMMGLPISRLILATNENDILARFFNSGDYSRGAVVPTVSPAMDIQVASNFERYLYYRANCDSAAVAQMMKSFARGEGLKIAAGATGAIDDLIRARRVDRPETIATIARVQRESGYVLDPHTAVGVAAAAELAEPGIPLVALATAHPAKFPDVIAEACGVAARHPALEGLEGKPTRQVELPAEEDAVRAFIEAQLAQ